MRKKKETKIYKHAQTLKCESPYCNNDAIVEIRNKLYCEECALDEFVKSDVERKLSNGTI